MHSSTSINNSAGFTDHVLIIAALGQVAMLCQQYHTSHLRLMSGAEERRITDSSPFNYLTIHPISLFVYPLLAVPHSIILSLTEMY